METEKTVEGECLCGSVRVTAKPKTNQFGACHCGICSQWGGGPLLAVECEDRVSFEGDSHIGVYASSEWAERGCCKQRSEERRVGREWGHGPGRGGERRKCGK